MDKSIVDEKKWQNLDKKNRINLFNTILGPRTVCLIASKSSSNISNLAIFNTVCPYGSNPPIVGFMMRPLTVERHTYDNIKRSKEYTINVVNSEILENAHQTARKYSAEESEFTETNLTEEYYQGHSVPIVKESKISLLMNYEEEHLIKANETRIIIGKVKSIVVQEALVTSDNVLNHEIADTILVNGFEAYYNSKSIKSMPYPR